MQLNDSKHMTNAYASVKITAVETIPLRMPFNVPFKIASGAARPFVDIMLVRLHTNEGITGIGETQAWRRQGSSETLASLNCTINEHFTPHIVGRSPFDIAAIMPKLEDAVYHSLYAQAAISDALYDLQGKLLGVPVHALLGGKCRDKVTACAVVTIKPTLEQTLDGAAEYYDKGYRAFTVKIGVDPAADVQNVRGIRERFGDGVTIRVDANAGMGFDAALALMKKLEPFDIDAAEQLLALWDIDGMAELARRIDIPLMSDECVSTVHDLIHVIRKRAASVVQSKVAKNGGIWYGRRLWHIADAAGMRIYPGNHPSTSIATASVAHQAAAWAGPLLEGPFPVGIATFETDVVTHPIRMEGPDVLVPDGPGLGVTLDEDRVKKLRLDV